MKKGVRVVRLDPVSWDVYYVNQKVEEYKSQLKEIPYNLIYEPNTFALLTNHVLKSRWEFSVVSTLTVEDDFGDVYCTTCEMDFKLVNPTTFKHGADILLEAIIPILREEFNNLEPTTLLITGWGNITIGNHNATTNANRSRSKTKRKR